MRNNELGLLGLPIQFSSDTNQRKQELEEALNTGYDEINDKLGQAAFREWGKNIVLVDTPTEYLELVSQDDPGSRQSLKEDLAANSLSHACTSYNTNIVYVNGASFESPLQAAHIMAHETIHAWAGRQAVSFQEIQATHVFDREDILHHLEDRANEGLVDFCALNALGLLEAPITRLGGLDLIASARSALVVRELALGLGSQPEKKMFRITQGTLPRREIMDINTRLKSDPFRRSNAGFFESGFLLTIGCMRLLKHRNFLEPGELEEKISQALTWIANSTGQSRPKFIGRRDFIEADEFIRNALKTQ